MSDATTYQAKRRAVMRNGVHKLYYVYEFDGTGYVEASRGYPHSTSAYAKLGRITNAEAQKDLLSYVKS